MPDRYSEYDRDRQDRGFDRDRFERDRFARGERGIVDRAGDEVRSWFGDDEAVRRRRMDEQERWREERWRTGERDYGPSRNVGSDRPYSERDYSIGSAPGGWRNEGYREYADRYGRPYSAASDIGNTQEFGREAYAGRRYGREWASTESWRVPGPYAGRGPRGYQRSDERIGEELNDRLTAHGLIDATEIQCQIQNGEVTLTGFVDSRQAKRAAEDLAEDITGVREVHNQLRIRSHAEDTGVGRTSALGLTEHEVQTTKKTGGRT
jgi:osmotically-inducible protein OsmY